ncbi:MAG: NRDE family protein [Flavobacteriales bacterium]|nr:NRDE family protein [Flavobacteriales bacterium]
MCLIAIAYKVHPRYPLIVAANRDEFLDRLAEPARFWPAEPHVLAGRDRRAGGTWLGVTTGGRFAALTNYRDLRLPRVPGPSRGMLVRQALDHGFVPADTSDYEGFNLVYGTVDALRYHTNIDGREEALSPGVHGLSNHLLNTPWPKVQHAKDRLSAVIDADEPAVDAIFEMLSDATQASDEQLPDTGLDLERERALSSICITTEGYGTRCSTVVLVANDGTITFEERVREPRSTSRYSFRPGGIATS